MKQDVYKSHGSIHYGGSLFSLLTQTISKYLKIPVCLFFFNFLFIFFFFKFMAVLGLRFCARAFSSCGKRGPLFIAVRGPLAIAASLAAGHRLQTRRLSNCGSRAELLRGMWDPPRPGLEPVSPAPAGRLSTTAPPGTSADIFPASIVAFSLFFHFLIAHLFLHPIYSSMFSPHCRNDFQLQHFQIFLGEKKSHLVQK